MTRILKWDVPVDGEFHEIGSGWVVHTSIQKQPDVVQVWTEEEAGEAKLERLVTVVGTGMQYPPREGGMWVHIGSAMTTFVKESLVWHVLEFRPNAGPGYVKGRGALNAG